MVVRILLFAARCLLFPLVAISYLTVSPVAAQEPEDLRAVLITGTSTGIGLRMTEILSQNGFFVYAGARKAEDLERLDAMENVKAVRLDVTVQTEIDAAVEIVRAEGRGLYGLINNAGVTVMGPLIEQPEEELDFIIDVNLLGPYRVTRAFADLLIESEGRVLTVSSIAGILSGPFIGAYSMTKHGVEAYTDALAAELQRFNVAVAAVEPGNYKSQIMASMVRRMREAGYSAEGSRYGSMLDLISGPLDRSQFNEPTDVALAALDFLTSESPKRRYMVVPNRAEAEITIRQALLELVQLNQDQPYAFTRDELLRMLDEVLGATGRAASRPSPPPEGQRDLRFHEAIVRGDLEAVRELIEAGVDLNGREPSGGSSPLISAATFGQTEAAKVLIGAGADLDQQNNEGSTALITAAFFAHADIVEALLAAGADKSIRNNNGSTALDAVTPPFEAVRNIYDFVGAALAPYGLELDYERIEATRPRIAELLR
ncbi:MAG: SDR family NAD(P)-dependent oxidoreductase [Gemmatimonadota bacterium]|nr:MAG: SDR family NAD(P)-dependent oxidoreductase [Gemmatimonadota bacterium]